MENTTTIPWDILLHLLFWSKIESSNKVALVLNRLAWIYQNSNWCFDIEMVLFQPNTLHLLMKGRPINQHHCFVYREFFHHTRVRNLDKMILVALNRQKNSHHHHLKSRILIDWDLQLNINMKSFEIIPFQLSHTSSFLREKIRDFRLFSDFFFLFFLCFPLRRSTWWLRHLKRGFYLNIIYILGWPLNLNTLFKFHLPWIFTDENYFLKEIIS